MLKHPQFPPPMKAVNREELTTANPASRPWGNDNPSNPDVVRLIASGGLLRPHITLNGWQNGTGGGPTLGAHTQRLNTVACEELSDRMSKVSPLLPR